MIAPHRILLEAPVSNRSLLLTVEVHLTAGSLPSRTGHSRLHGCVAGDSFVVDHFVLIVDEGRDLVPRVDLPREPDQRS